MAGLDISYKVNDFLVLICHCSASRVEGSGEVKPTDGGRRHRFLPNCEDRASKAVV